MSPPALETRGLTKSFGPLTVANAIDFGLERGARHALIGPNGAGKTSFVNLVTGALPPNAGQILLDGADVTGLPQAARVKRGLVRTFQITALFHRLSALENVALAVCERQGTQRITVLVQGSVLVEGPPQAISADLRVRQVYLGERGPA